MDDNRTVMTMPTNWHSVNMSRAQFYVYFCRNRMDMVLVYHRLRNEVATLTPNQNHVNKHVLQQDIC